MGDCRSDSGVEFRLLGPIEVVAGGRPVPLEGLRQQKVLAWLMLNSGSTVTVDRLVDVVWDGYAPDTAAKQVRNAVAVLRRVLQRSGAGPSSLVTMGNAGYAFRLGQHQLDVRRFEEALASAETMAEPAEAGRMLRGALALWRGPALAGLDGISLCAAATGLDELRLTVLERRVQCDLALGRHHQIVGELRRLVVDHPLRERLRGYLMLALHRCGRQADALGAFEEGRVMLSERTGLDVSGDLTDLRNGILRGSTSVSDNAALWHGWRPPAVQLAMVRAPGR